VHGVIITQPGRVQTPAGGIFAAYQGLPADASPGTGDAGSARVEDIAPTLLNLIGVPLSRELAGTPVTAIPAGGHAPRYVETYGRPFTATAAREGKPLDQEMIDRLRSLGYLR
jgi:hypothetical protein